MSDASPSPFDRALGAFDGLPDIVRTRESIVRVMPFMGIGGSSMFVVQTIRQCFEDRASQDTIFLECVREEAQGGTIKLVLPPDVTAILQRQYDSLTTKNRKKGARKAVQTRRERGIEPGFLKKGKGK